LRRSGPVDEATLERVARWLKLERQDLLAHQWVDNGPGWMAVMLASPEAVLALQPDFGGERNVEIGVVAPYPSGHDVAFEVRAFFPLASGIGEDPVTGSLNAGLAQWLIGSGRAPDRYVASQGTALGRRGRVHVQRDGETIWIGGDVTPCVTGSVQL
jgi:PhzF family phenazine biosynthesis protein